VSPVIVHNRGRNFAQQVGFDVVTGQIRCITGHDENRRQAGELGVTGLPPRRRRRSRSRAHRFTTSPSRPRCRCACDSSHGVIISFRRSRPRVSTERQSPRRSRSCSPPAITRSRPSPRRCHIPSLGVIARRYEIKFRYILPMYIKSSIYLAGANGAAQE